MVFLLCFILSYHSGKRKRKKFEGLYYIFGGLGDNIKMVSFGSLNTEKTGTDIIIEERKFIK